MNWRLVAQQAWNGYVAALAMVWGPFVAILTFIRTWAILIVPTLVLAFTGGMGLMVISAWAEMWFIALLGLAVAFPTSLLLAALLWIYVVRLRIGIDLLQIPAGEVMEMLRETGQLVRLQDPRVRDGEGNIRLFNSANIMAAGRRAFCLPAWVLTMGLWLVAFPHVVTLAALGVIGGGGLAATFWLRQRGRRVGLGFDFLAGAMIHYIFGGVGTILFRALLGQWWDVLAGAISGRAAHAPAAVGLDGLLANVWYRLFHGWISWPTSVADVFGIVLGTLLLLGLIGFHVAVITAIVRFLKEPPEGEARPSVSLVSPGAVKVLGTAGRGDVAETPFAKSWFWAAGILVALGGLLWLAGRFYGTNEYVCRFGGLALALVIALAAAGLLVGLVKLGFPRFGRVLGWLAIGVVLLGFSYNAVANWDDLGRVCHAGIVAEQRAEPLRNDPSPTCSEPPPPSRRNGSSEPRRSESGEDGRIATFFATNGTTCPNAASRRGWESLRDAQASCRSENWLARNADWRR